MKMKFRMKIALCMICLLSLLFGIGGSTLIFTSFRQGLEAEKLSARETYQRLLGTLQAVAAAGGWSDSEDIASVLEEMYAQEPEVWPAIRLREGDRVIYESGGLSRYFDDSGLQPEEGYCLSSGFADEQGRQYLQLSGHFVKGEEPLLLDTAFDISSVYELRTQQQRMYHRVFSVVILLCAVLSYSTAWLLTRKLTSLSVAAEEIAAGNFGYRSRIQSEDEIGSLSAEFDAMAERVQQNIEELEASVERQEQFMGSFAHEIKTPMTSIIGYADLLKGGRLTPQEQAEAAEYIFSEGKRMESLSLRLLDIFVAGREEAEFQNVSPGHLAEETVRHLEPVCRREGLELTCQYEEGECLLEPDLFRSLLLNLIDNGRKAMEGKKGGKIAVLVRQIPGGCRVCVRDNGRGIPQEAVNHLTEAFYRVDKSRDRSLGGAGLGLTLCERIVQLHHGALRIESRPGVGTTVIAELRGGVKA